MITAKDILSLKGSKIQSVDHNTTMFETVGIMVEKKIGAVTIEENGVIKGFLTERDFMRNVVKQDFDIHKTKVGDCVLSEVNTVPHTTSLFELQASFIGLYTRHLFITLNEEIVGLLSVGDVMKADLNSQKEQMDKLKSYVSMEYYEKWNWDAKKK